MAIKRVEIKDFLVFKGDFAADFCEGVNVIIGGNGTGKTTLMKALFYGADRFSIPKKYPKPLQCYYGISEDISIHNYEESEIAKQDFGIIKLTVGKEVFEYTFSLFKQPNTSETTLNPVYIPEKDILEHANGLLPFIEQRSTGFTPIYKDVLVRAQDIPIKEQTEIQKEIGEMITDIIGGHIEWVHGEGAFYTIRTNGTRIPFAAEASGFKKFGFLGLLVVSGQLNPGSVLFWDEPENSLNPKYVPILVEILHKLAQNKVQIFIATHSDFLCKWFELKTSNSSDDKIKFFSLYKDNENINVEVSKTYRSLEHNSIIEQSVELYNEHLRRATDNNED